MREVVLRDKNNQQWGEKTNIAWSKIPYFLKMFPEGKTFLIVRDPRDVLCSFKRLTTAPYPDYLDSIFANLSAFQSARRFKGELSKKNFFLIKYEDIVNNPEKSVREICDFLEVEYAADMLCTAGYRDKKNRKWKSDTMFDEPLKGISNRPVSRWKEFISDEELFLAEAILGREMVDSGYRLSDRVFGAEVADNSFSLIRSSNLLKQRFAYWIETGNGREAYPTDPLNSSNWQVTEKINNLENYVNNYENKSIRR